MQMLYDKPSRWAYTFQVKAPEYILSSSDVVILRKLTLPPVLSSVRTTRVLAESVRSFRARLGNSGMLKIPFSSTSAPLTQTGNRANLTSRKHAL